MIRSLTHALLCLAICLTLSVSGAKVAAARLSMALEAASLTEMTICADGQVQTVLLTAEGEVATPSSKGKCVTCPDCRQAAAVEHLAPALAVTQVRSLVVVASVLPTRFTLLFARGLHQPRAPPTSAPPKGL